MFVESCVVSPYYLFDACSAISCFLPDIGKLFFFFVGLTRGLSILLILSRNLPGHPRQALYHFSHALYFVFEKGSHAHFAWNGLELIILLSPLPE
jgi:hypothetical protein